MNSRNVSSSFKDFKNYNKVIIISFFFEVKSLKELIRYFNKIIKD